MSGLRILITNHTLAGRGGSELYVRDTALELLKRGHTPLAYSSDLGDVAQELQAAGITVVDDLNLLAETPDLIHGQQHMELMTALLHFPDVPAVQFIHSSRSWYEKPVHFPRILRYVAVDHGCRDLLLAHGVAEDRVRVLLNFVDLARFKSREQSLPATPRRALLFSNYAGEETHLPAVRDACARARIELDVIGSGANTTTSQPEKILSEYDLVFAKGRCALEAMAVGAAVVLCDREGSGPLVDSKNFATLRPLNFGRAALDKPLDAALVLAEIRRYEPVEALRVSQIVRAGAGHETVIDEIINLYGEVKREFELNGAVSRVGGKLAEDRAAAAYLRQLKVDFTTQAHAAVRLRERLESVPLIGRVGVRLARAFMRRA
jgi:hypothetical protein